MRVATIESWDLMLAKANVFCGFLLKGSCYIEPIEPIEPIEAVKQWFSGVAIAMLAYLISGNETCLFQ